MADESSESARLAVLIDADNARPSVVEGLLAEVAKYGVAGVRRIGSVATLRSRPGQVQTAAWRDGGERPR